MSTQEDNDSNEFFAEIEKDNKNQYEKCSAVDAFDAVFNCYRVKEQAKHYYRYGTKRDCEAKWDYFKLCFSTKLKSAEKADSMLRAHKEVMNEKRSSGPSSEDVWESRI